MKRVIGSWLFAAIAMLVTAAKAQPTAAGPTTAPATQPATQPAADVAALIRQLGDDDFHVRLEAARQLKAVGKAAEPALVQARKSDDPEVHARVEEILAELNRPPVDDSAVPQPAPVGGNNAGVYSSRTTMPGDGTRTIDIAEPGRTIHIEEKPSGLYIKVTGQLDGKPATREYSAKSVEQLKQEHPAAFALYQQRTGFGVHVAGANGRGNNVVVNARIQINGGNGIINIGPAVGAQPRNIRDVVKTNALEAHLLGVMRAQGIADAQQQELRNLLGKLRQAIPDPQKAGKDKEAAELDYERAGDAVRGKIAELKLGDFDAMLPPKPAKQ